MIKKIFLICLILIQQNLFSKTPFHWEKIHVYIEVLSNGDFLVQETQTYVFNENYSRERYRYIPLDKVDSIMDITVEENGVFLKIRTGNKNNEKWIQWTHELNPPESHTFKISYRVVGGLQTIGSNKSLYWKAIFKTRKADILDAKVNIKLPESLKNKVSDYNAYGVKYGVNLISPTEYEFYSKDIMKPNVEMEIQINFQEKDLR